MKMSAKHWAIILGFFLVVLIASGLMIQWRKSSAFIYSTHRSPDGRFMVQVFEYPRLFGHMPGDAGSGSGYVQLVDTRTGRVMESKSTDMVMTVDIVRWEQGSVDVALFEKWQLPK